MVWGGTADLRLTGQKESLPMQLSQEHSQAGRTVCAKAVSTTKPGIFQAGGDQMKTRGLRTEDEVRDNWKALL